MDWLLRLNISAVAGSAYFFGLLLYRLNLSYRDFKKSSEELKSTMDSMRNFEVIEPNRAQTSTQADLAKLIRERRRLLKAKEQRAKARERRLIEHLGSLQIDERQS